MYKLHSISGKSNPIEDISDGYQRQIELIKGIPYCCKVNLIDERPPVQIKFRYAHGYHQSYMNIYGSFSE
jgi:hypothetical protein